MEFIRFSTRGNHFVILSLSPRTGYEEAVAARLDNNSAPIPIQSEEAEIP
jgi:hypothetical protein